MIWHLWWFEDSQAWSLYTMEDALEKINYIICDSVSDLAISLIYQSQFTMMLGYSKICTENSHQLSEVWANGCSLAFPDTWGRFPV